MPPKQRRGDASDESVVSPLDEAEQVKLVASLREESRKHNRMARVVLVAAFVFFSAVSAWHCLTIFRDPIYAMAWLRPMREKISFDALLASHLCQTGCLVSSAFTIYGAAGSAKYIGALLSVFPMYAWSRYVTIEHSFQPCNIFNNRRPDSCLMHTSQSLRYGSH